MSVSVFVCCLKLAADKYYFYNPLTYNNERVVDVHAAKAVGSLTNISPCVLGLHLFDAQSML